VNSYNLIDVGPIPPAVLESFNRLRPSGAPGVSMLAMGGPIRRDASGAIGLPDPHSDPGHWMHHSPEPVALEYLKRTVLPTLLDAAGPSASEVAIIQRRLEALEGGSGVGGRPRHRDDSVVVAVLAAARVHIEGGATSVYATDDPAGPALFSAELQGGQCLYFRDDRVWHDITPIRASGPGAGRRDLFVISIARPRR
jgi:2OG-Fe dioxygenase